MAHDLTSVPFVWPGETHGVLLNGRGVTLGHTAVVGPPGGKSGYFGHRRPALSGGRSWDGSSGARNSTPQSDDEEADDGRIEPPTCCSLPVIDVEPGKTYRFRFIGSTGLSFLAMGIEDHSNLTIFQVDGSEYNVPVTVDHLQLGSGQRLDVLFQAKSVEELTESDNKATYFIQFETRDRPDPYRGYAVIRYNHDVEVPAAPPAPVLDLLNDTTTWLEYTLQPLYPERNQAPSAQEVTRRVIIDSEQKVDNATGRVVWDLAHLASTDLTYQRPVLVDIYRRGDAAVPDYDAALGNYGWDPATKTFPARIGEVLEVVLQNRGSLDPTVAGLVETHPFHAHSQHYYDIGSGPGEYDADANNAKLAELGYRSVKRDTTMLFQYQGQAAGPCEAAGWRAWRLRVSNPGVWMIHCHILAHMVMGMQSVWVVGDAEQIIRLPLPVSQEYFHYGGSVYGDATRAPAVYHVFDGVDKCHRK